MGGSQCEVLLRAPGFLWGRGCRSFFSSLSTCQAPRYHSLSLSLHSGQLPAFPLPLPAGCVSCPSTSEYTSLSSCFSKLPCLCILSLSLSLSVSLCLSALLTLSLSASVSFRLSLTMSLSWFFLSLCFSLFFSLLLYFSLSSSLLFLLPSSFPPPSLSLSGSF